MGPALKTEALARSSYDEVVRWVSLQRDQCPYRKRKFGETDRWIHVEERRREDTREEGLVKTHGKKAL